MFGSKRYCSVCSRRKIEHRHLKLHPFPKDPQRCMEWLKILDIPNLKDKTLKQLNETYRVCSLHFSDDQYHHSGRLMFSAYPTEELCNMSNEQRERASSPEFIEPGELPDELMEDSDLGEDSNSGNRANALKIENTGGSPSGRLEDNSSRLLEFEPPNEPEAKFRPQEPSKKLIKVGHSMDSGVFGEKGIIEVDLLEMDDNAIDVSDSEIIKETAERLTDNKLPEETGSKSKLGERSEGTLEVSHEGYFADQIVMFQGSDAFDGSSSMIEVGLMDVKDEPLDYVDSDDNDIDGDDEDDDEEDGEEDGDEDENIITMEDDPLHIDAEFLNMKSESPELPKYSTKLAFADSDQGQRGSSKLTSSVSTSKPYRQLKKFNLRSKKTKLPMKKSKAKVRVNRCSQCSCQRSNDEHLECSAHAQCSRNGHFDPLSCDICCPSVQALLDAEVIDKDSEHWKKLKNRFLVATKWASRRNLPMGWLDEKLGHKLQILKDPYHSSGVAQVAAAEPKLSQDKLVDEKASIPLHSQEYFSSSSSDESTGSNYGVRSNRRKRKKKKAAQCSCCLIPIREDGHRKCSAHASCSKSGVFNPQACRICSPHVKALLRAGSIDKKSVHWKALKGRFTNAKKWASRKGIVMKWADDKLRCTLQLNRDYMRSKSEVPKATSAQQPSNPPKSDTIQENPLSQDNFRDIVYKYVTEVLQEKCSEDLLQNLPGAHSSRSSRARRGKEARSCSPLPPPKRKRNISPHSALDHSLSAKEGSSGLQHDTVHSGTIPSPSFESYNMPLPLPVTPDKPPAIGVLAEGTGNSLPGIWFPVPSDWNVSMVGGKLVATKPYLDENGAICRRPIDNVEFQITRNSGNSVMKCRFVPSTDNGSSQSWKAALNMLKQSLAEADQLFPEKEANVTVALSPTSNGVDVDFHQEPSPALKALGEEFVDLWRSVADAYAPKMLSLPPGFTGINSMAGSSAYAQAFRFLSAPPIQMDTIPAHLRRPRIHYVEADGRTRQSTLALSSVQAALAYGSDFAGRMAEKLQSDPELDAVSVIRLLQQQMLDAAQSLTFHIKDLLKQAIHFRLCLRKDTIPKVNESYQYKILKGDPFAADIFGPSLREALESQQPAKRD
ncbi:uncharacterized protein LOC122256612 isoform X3 [Penaeus japonicus]|uniref:uncharacterized protein LOC122256612 isoform X3 n=2 Tax=Penaeus japonicus TaxID=27405 RepID=UPI001C713526|nr:uncharacterized protein LOC122256612 isoform X3 [Penaeus japonicus]